MAEMNIVYGTDNAEFETVMADDVSAHGRIFRAILDAMIDGKSGGLIHDLNGNRIGWWTSKAAAPK